MEILSHLFGVGGGFPEALKARSIPGLSLCQRIVNACCG